MPTENRVLNGADIEAAWALAHDMPNQTGNTFSVRQWTQIVDFARRIEALTIERMIDGEEDRQRRIATRSVERLTLGKSPVADAGMRSVCSPQGPADRQETSEGAEDGMGGGRLETGLDTIHKLPEGKRANSGAGDTQPLTKGPGGESGIPGRHPSDPPPEDEMTDGHGSWDSVSPSPDGPEQSGAGSGARGAAIARQSSDPVAQEIERLQQELLDWFAAFSGGKTFAIPRVRALASLARRLIKENAALADQAFEANADAIKAHSAAFADTIEKAAKRADGYGCETHCNCGEKHQCVCGDAIAADIRSLAAKEQP